MIDASDMLLEVNKQPVQLDLPHETIEYACVDPGTSRWAATVKCVERPDGIGWNVIFRHGKFNSMFGASPESEFPELVVKAINTLLCLIKETFLSQTDRVYIEPFENPEYWRLFEGTVMKSSYFPSSEYEVKRINKHESFGRHIPEKKYIRIRLRSTDESST